MPLKTNLALAYAAGAATVLVAEAGAFHWRLTHGPRHAPPMTNAAEPAKPAAASEPTDARQATAADAPVAEAAKPSAGKTLAGRTFAGRTFAGRTPAASHASLRRARRPRPELQLDPIDGELAE